MTNEELELQVDAAMAAEVEKRRAALREEIASKARHEAAIAHNRKCNAPHPSELPPSAEEQAERNRLADEDLERQRQRIESNNQRFAKLEEDQAAARRQ